MNQRLAIFITTLFIAVLGVFQGVSAQSPSIVPISEPISAQEESQNFGPHFFSNETVVISDVLSGDVYAVGGTVRVDGAVTGDLMVAGGQVIINGDISEDIRVAGGTVVINGVVGGSVTAVGGSLSFGPSSDIAGSVVTAGGNILLDGSIAQNVVVYAGSVSASGQNLANVQVTSSAAALLPSTQIAGNLRIATEDPEAVSDEASVSGTREVVVLTPDVAAVSEETKNTVAEAVGAFQVISRVYGWLAGLVVGSILLYFFPKTAQTLVTTVKKSLVAAFGWGVLYIVVAPVVAVFFLVTVVGLPLGLMVIFAYILDLIAASWVTGLVLGKYLSERTKATWLQSRYAQYLVGYSLLMLAAALPILGGLLSLFAVCVGMGSFVLLAYSWAQSKRL